MFPLDVDCYAGHRGEETPRRFRIGERSLSVEEVLDRWIGPDHRYFKVRSNDGVYILRHLPAEDLWELARFERGTGSDRRPVLAPEAGEHRHAVPLTGGRYWKRW